MNALMSEDFVPRHRFTVQDYYRMAEVGLLAPDARVELIEGEVIDMAPQGTHHAEILRRLARLLFLAAADRATVQTQCPLRLDDFSEPEPDFALLERRKEGYLTSHPGAADTLLVVEVSHSSLRFDRIRKLPLYARHGIPEYWIVDVATPRLHVFHSPDNGRYTHSSSTGRPAAAALRAMPEMRIDLTGLFDGL
jgi:Uma2 family endonuclease